jgi:uncharacterized protein
MPTPTRSLTALITGATSGIGLALAEELARRKYDLVIAARRAEELGVVAVDLSERHSIGVEKVALDLSEPDAADRLAGQLRLDDRPIDVLVNNAGFAQYGPFVETDAEAELRMLYLNIFTVTRLTKLLLPSMVARGSGRVLNVASTAAFMPGPLMAVYYASKAYVLSFSEALAEEARGSGVTVTALCPGPTRTGFQARAEMEESKLVKNRSIMDAAAVAHAGIEGALRGRSLVIPGATNKLQTLVPRLLPRFLVPRLVKAAQARTTS